jgi:hypothetical protein
MRVISVVVKLLVVAAALGACAWMASRIGPWKALGLWTATSGLACGAVALTMRRQTPGKVTFLNYVMGYVLQWGYRVGRGKLPAIVVTSWCVWALLGAAVVIAMNAAGAREATTSPNIVEGSQTRGATVMVLLALSWIVDGGLLMWLAGICMSGGRSGGAIRALAPVMALLVAMILASVALVTLRTSARSANIALLVAGGPPLLVGLGYGLFVLLIVTVGRKARWN